MDRKAKNAVQPVAVGIGERIADRLVKHRAMEKTPDGLIHNTQVFAVRLKCVLLGRQEHAEVDDVYQGRQGH